MRYYTAVVKGDRKTAIWAAGRYAIEVVAVVKELEKETVIRVDGDDLTLSRLQNWLAETGDCIEGRGYPDGELLIYSEHDTDKEGPKWRSTVDYNDTNSHSYWVEEREGNRPTSPRTYDASIRFDEVEGIWRVCETQWITIERTAEKVESD